MLQQHNRQNSMSIYLAALTIPDTTILCLGKWNGSILELYLTSTALVHMVLFHQKFSKECDKQTYKSLYF